MVYIDGLPAQWAERKGLSPTFEYCTISHVWGYTNHSISIGEPARSVAMNDNRAKSEFLLELDKLPTPYWLDTYAIDQSNDEVKGQQISQMGVVYLHAVCCIIIIESEDLYSIASEIHSAMNHGLSRRLYYAIDKFVAMLDGLVYYTRVWTLQETLLSRRIEYICCSTVSDDWSRVHAEMFNGLVENEDDRRELHEERARIKTKSSTGRGPKIAVPVDPTGREWYDKLMAVEPWRATDKGSLSTLYELLRSEPNGGSAADSKTVYGFGAGRNGVGYGSLRQESLQNDAWTYLVSETPRLATVTKDQVFSMVNLIGVELTCKYTDDLAVVLRDWIMGCRRKGLIPWGSYMGMTEVYHDGSTNPHLCSPEECMIIAEIVELDSVMKGLDYAEAYQMSVRISRKFAALNKRSSTDSAMFKVAACTISSNWITDRTEGPRTEWPHFAIYGENPLHSVDASNYAEYPRGARVVFLISNSWTISATAGGDFNAQEYLSCIWNTCKVTSVLTSGRYNHIVVGFIDGTHTGKDEVEFMYGYDLFTPQPFDDFPDPSVGLVYLLARKMGVGVSASRWVLGCIPMGYQEEYVLESWFVDEPGKVRCMSLKSSPMRALQLEACDIDVSGRLSDESYRNPHSLNVELVELMSQYNTFLVGKFGSLDTPE
ncbi:hypothetical protein HDU84_004946 [Entophlyctis sp. JEL0112]|nr:hypothetical protein HDU84_004946 [Entophlyctis sp. JEL0112]